MIVKTKLRHVESNDLSDILFLFKSSIEQTCSTHYTTQQTSAWVSVISNEEKWKRKFQEQHFIVAEINNQIVGFAFKEKNHLDLLYVHPDFQQFGIGSELYLSLEDVARREMYSSITTESSITAKEFFHKKGFKIIAKQIVQINGIDIPNLKMEKELKY